MDIEKQKPSGDELSEKAVLRKFEEKDRESIRTICRETGQRGNSTWIFFEDEEIIPMIYAEYYMDYEPEACYVAEVDGRVVGCLLNCLKARQHLRVLRTRIYPRVCLRILWKIITLQYRQKQTYQTLWWIISRSWREALPIPRDQYPVHSHFNFEAAYRGYGLAGKLALMAYSRALEIGLRGSHQVIREEEGDDRLSTFVCREFGFKIVAVKRQTVWDKMTGKKWFAKLLVCDFHPESEGKPDASAEH